MLERTRLDYLVQYHDMIERMGRVSNICPPGKLHDLLAAIEDGRVKTAADCKRLTGKYPAAWRGEVKRKRCKYHDRKGEILDLLDSLTR
jgi:hypothetical protein